MFKRKLSKIFIIISVMLHSFFSYAAQAQYSMEDILFSKKENNRQVYGINVEVLDYFINKIGVHSANYPPSFKDKKERNAIELELKKLILIMKEPAEESQNKNIGFLIRYGLVLSMAHNLDFPDSGKEASIIFEQALAIDKNNSKANYFYGEFLYSSAQGEKSIPYLKRAINAGEKNAKWTLAVVSSGKKETWPQAIKYFEEYANDFPNTKSAEQALKMAKGLRSGDVKIKVVHE